MFSCFFFPPLYYRLYVLSLCSLLMLYTLSSFPVLQSFLELYKLLQYNFSCPSSHVSLLLFPSSLLSLLYIILILSSSVLYLIFLPRPLVLSPQFYHPLLFSDPYSFWYASFLDFCVPSSLFLKSSLSFLLLSFYNHQYLLSRFSGLFLSLLTLITLARLHTSISFHLILLPLSLSFCLSSATYSYVTTTLSFDTFSCLLPSYVFLFSKSLPISLVNCFLFYSHSVVSLLPCYSLSTTSFHQYLLYASFLFPFPSYFFYYALPPSFFLHFPLFFFPSPLPFFFYYSWSLKSSFSLTDTSILSRLSHFPFYPFYHHPCHPYNMFSCCSSFSFPRL